MTMVWVCLLVVVVGLAIFSRLANRTVAERTPDEQTYISYATRVAQSGASAVPLLVNDFNGTKDRWLYPPPTRVGFIFLVAGVMKLSGASAEKAAVWLSFAFSLLGFFLAGLLGCRLFNRWVALIALALLSVSPVDLALARRAWQDSVVAGVAVLLLYLCAEASISPRPRWWRVCFWIVAAYFLLLKESALIIYALLVIWLLLDVWRRGFSWKTASVVAISSGLVVVVSYGAAMWLAGGARPFLQVYQHLAQGLTWNQYVYRYQCGPWYSFPLGFWVLSPITTLLGGLGIGYILFRRKSLSAVLDLDPRQAQGALALALFVCALLTAATLPEGFKCLRYVSMVQAPLYLIAGLFITYLLTRARSRLAPGGRSIAICLAVVALALVCLADYKRFQRIFVRDALGDLTIVRVVNVALATQTRPNPGWSEDRDGPAEFRSAFQLTRSQAFYDRGQYPEAIAAAKEALRLRPNYAAAWNNIGAAYNALGQFDKGAAACEEALRLQPNFPLAWNNLKFARAQLEKTRE
jgi:tetratricopeptide (TPR) repeat protein